MPQAVTLAATVASAPALTAEKKGGWLKWVFIVPAGLFGLMIFLGAVSDPNGKSATARFEKQKQECSEAMMSSIGRSTTGYADHAAYQARVRDKCDGLTLNGKPLGQ